MADYITMEEMFDIAMISNPIQKAAVPCKHFIETGTKYGHTARMASMMFENVHTIEINK